MTCSRPHNRQFRDRSRVVLQLSPLVFSFLPDLPAGHSKMLGQSLFLNYVLAFLCLNILGPVPSIQSSTIEPPCYFSVTQILPVPQPSVYFIEAFNLVHQAGSRALCHETMNWASPGRKGSYRMSLTDGLHLISLDSPDSTTVFRCQ